MGGDQQLKVANRYKCGPIKNQVSKDSNQYRMEEKKNMKQSTPMAKAITNW